MPVEAEWERVGQGHPDQCKSRGSVSQCPFKQINGSGYCPRHAGNLQGDVKRKEEMRNYNLTKFRSQIMEKADNPKVKSLREEIGILRIVLETIINRCQTDNDLIMQSPKITDIITKIDKIVSSCHRLEAATGQLLDRQIAMTFADKLVQIVNVNIQDPTLVGKISMEFVQALEASMDPAALLTEQTYGPNTTLDAPDDEE